MNMNFLAPLMNFVKLHRKKLIGILMVAIVFSLLIIEAIHLLSFPNQNAGNGGQNKKTAQADDQQPDTRKKDRESSDDSEKSDIQPTPASPYKNLPHGLDPALDESVKKRIPDINIDLTRRREYPDQPSFGSGGSYSVVAGEKPKHHPIAEIAGIVDSPFLRIYTMISYGDNKWSIPTDAYYTRYNQTEVEGLEQIKMKPFLPSKGFIPVASNCKSVRFPVQEVVHFPNQDIFYTEENIADEYDMYCTIPAPNDNQLRVASADDTKNYTIQCSPDLYDLARRITTGKETAFDKAAAIAEYLENKYELEKEDSVNAISSEALTDFLFITKKGSQLDFISAYVWLLWCSDISARVATGYRINTESNYQIVYGDQLCVYPEIYFTEYGWTPMDVFAYQPYIPPKATEITVNEIEPVVKKGTTFHVRGTVKDDTGAAVDGVPVMIYLKKDKNEGCLAYATGETTQGQYDIECTLNRDTDVGNYHVVAHALENDQYRGSWSDPEIKVVAEAFLELTVPQNVLEGRAFKVGGVIGEDLTGKPIEEAAFHFTFDQGITAEREDQSAKLDKGRFSEILQLDVPDSVKPDGNYFFVQQYKTNFTLEYPGSEFYFPCSRTGEIGIWRILWYRILTAVLLALLIPLCIVMIVKWKREKPEAAVITVQNCGMDIVPVETFTIEEKIPDPELPDMVFLQIDPGLPDVWSFDEPLTIRFLDGSGEFADLELRFDKKGRFTISVSTGGGSPSKHRIIRIVSYQEEIIALGKQLFARLHDTYHTMDIHKMTPREIIHGVPGDVRRRWKGEFFKVLSLFEKAAYGFVSVQRMDYEQFYHAMILIDTGLAEVET
jgi:transglutaminase-like putative cysteine protease